MPVITVPGKEYLKPAADATAAAALRGMKPTTNDGFFSQGIMYQESGTDNPSGLGLNQAWLVFPDAMYFAIPEQYNEGPINYRDQTGKLEQSIYKVIGMEGVRLYDPLVSRILFGNEFQAVTQV